MKWMSVGWTNVRRPAISRWVITPEPTAIATNVSPTSPAAAPPIKKYNVCQFWNVWDHESGMASHEGLLLLFPTDLDVGNHVGLGGPLPADDPELVASLDLAL